MDEALHFQFISVVFSRISTVATSSLPLLSLSFATRFPDPRTVRSLPPLQSFHQLSQGYYYATILSLFDDLPIVHPDLRQLFILLLSTLQTLGYRPGTPCDPARLTDGSREDHINFCVALEFLISEKSLNCEQLIDDLRKIPRSFFVLRGFPNHLDDAIALWLDKFPCLGDLYEIESDLQLEVGKWAHVAAALSRIYPSVIPKSRIHKSADLTQEAVNDNYNLAFSILNELNAYIPSKFPLCDHLFHLFIADVYWATRPGVRKLARFEPLPLLPAVKRPVSVQLPRIAHPTKRTSKVSRESRPVVQSAFDPQMEMDALLSIYRFMSSGERKNKFAEVTDPSVLIEAIVDLLGRNESDHSFASLERALRPLPQSDSHLANATIFLAALSGSNNEFAASRRIVFFARRMVRGGLPTPEAVRPWTHDPRSGMRPGGALSVSVRTQTGSMTQNLVIVREPVTLRRTRKMTGANAREAAVQTDQVSPVGVFTNQFATVSYPYGAKIAVR